MKFNFNNYMQEKYEDDPNYKRVTEFMNSEKNSIGNDILAKRISKGLSQKRAAEYLGISLNTYIMIESGTSSVENSILYDYLNKLNSYGNGLFSIFNLSDSVSENLIATNYFQNDKDYKPIGKINTYTA